MMVETSSWIAWIVLVGKVVLFWLWKWSRGIPGFK